MALVGSVVSKDMLPNRIYAGVLAKDVTDKMGHQFVTRTVDEKAAALQEILQKFLKENPQFEGQIKVVKSPEEIVPGVTCFDVSRRVYTKRLSEAEVRFLKANVPLIKFAPDGEAPFVVPQQAEQV